MSRSKQHPVLPSSYKRPSPGLGASVQQQGPIHAQVASNLPFSNSGLVDYNERGCSSFGALPPRPCTTGSTTGSKDIALHMANESNASVDAIWAVPAPAVGAVGGVGAVGTARPKNNKAMFSKSNSQLCTSTTAIEQVVQSYLPSSTSQQPQSRFKSSSTIPVPQTPQQKTGISADAGQNAQLQAALSKISTQVQEMSECTSRHAKALQALTEKVTEAHDISLKTQSSMQDMSKNMHDLKKMSATHATQIAQNKNFADNVDSTLKKVIAANNTNNQINSTLNQLQNQKMHRRVQV